MKSQIPGVVWNKSLDGRGHAFEELWKELEQLREFYCVRRFLKTLMNFDENYVVYMKWEGKGDSVFFCKILAGKYSICLKRESVFFCEFLASHGLLSHFGHQKG